LPQIARALASQNFAAKFDIENVLWSHRGDTCTFDTMIEEFDLGTPPLLRLATMVRGADTARPELSPQAPGLLAASLGLSRLYSDDLEQLEAGMLRAESISYPSLREATRTGGATVLRGPMGYGHSSRLQTARIMRLSFDLPIVVEIVDTDTKIKQFLPVLDRMMSSGLVTLEKVQVLQYGSEGLKERGEFA
jgi:hypothetical protein